jgi:hypothetical protein
MWPPGRFAAANCFARFEENLFCAFQAYRDGLSPAVSSQQRRGKFVRKQDQAQNPSRNNNHHLSARRK